MHKPAFAICLLALLTFSIPALAEAPGGGAPGSTGAPGGAAPGVTASSSGGAAAGTAAVAGEQKGPQGAAAFPSLPPEKLAEVKVQIMKNIDTIIDGLQKRKACVQAAASGEALHACGGLPRPGSMRREGPHAGGQSQQAPQ